MPELPAPAVARQRLEDSWRLKLEEARAQYQRTAILYRRMLEQKDESTGVVAADDLRRARQEESEALAEYRRVLQAFTDLVVHGKQPEKGPVASSNGA